MGKRTTIILNDKLFTKLLKIQTEKILERNASVSISSLINDMVGEKIQEINTKKGKTQNRQAQCHFRENFRYGKL